MRKIALIKKNLKLTDNVIGFFEKRVTPFGTGAKVDCPREYLRRRVYLVICKD